MRRIALALAVWPLASCAAFSSVTGPDHVLLRTSDGGRIDMEALVDELMGADVVFLGEEHDATVMHRLQLEVTRRLHRRHGDLVLSMEMFERDGQNALDLFLNGTIDEPQFLSMARTWSNYSDDYAPAVRFAKDNGVPVLAANCYRPIASRASRTGWRSAIGSPWAARQVDAGEGPYRDRFFASMADIPGHGGGFPAEMLQRFFEAQCIKDDTMAESIAQHFDAQGPAAPPVVHWCGRFHSDFGLGTVERLRARRPDLKILVVSGAKSEDLGRSAPPEDRQRGDFLWYVLP